ncbi:carbamate kinase [Hydrogenispora ethanolica]|uniref:Carbamate kinase n=1 Tax=Hydrogenispora ethanolica TaxID=1082276 RepID=A0A4R1S3F1_HYDET|nr:carbamate kinase [Hydrogenispora ethanolica]TCL73150.1 carbamate kinase [Hydrogenispora ethanolica]
MGSHQKVVIALGGNALQEPGAPATAEAQLEVVKKTAEIITDIKCIFGYELAIVHGNGPQIGRILLASELAAEVTPAMPLNVCTAMSQGYIGYHIQQGLSHALANRNRPLPVVTVITQVVVDPADPAFQNPTKPIGPFYSEEEAGKLAAERGFVLREDAGRGWRRVVPSPLPQRIVEIHSIKELWDSTIVIAAGGGGIPVIEKEDGTLEGVPAVIDKDLAAEKLAEEVGADILMILTEVEQVALNYKKANQQNLSRLTAAECEQYIREGHFAPGSMLPKIQAAQAFARLHPKKKAIITSLAKAVEALNGSAGTVITQQ